MASKKNKKNKKGLIFCLIFNIIEMFSPSSKIPILKTHFL